MSRRRRSPDPSTTTVPADVAPALAGRVVADLPTEVAHVLLAALLIERADLIAATEAATAKAERPAMRKLVSAAEIAAANSVNVATVWRWLKDGVIPEPVSRLGRCTRFDALEVEAALSKTRPAKPPRRRAPEIDPLDCSPSR